MNQLYAQTEVGGVKGVVSGSQVDVFRNPGGVVGKNSPGGTVLIVRVAVSRPAMMGNLRRE